MICRIVSRTVVKQKNLRMIRSRRTLSDRTAPWNSAVICGKSDRLLRILAAAVVRNQSCRTVLRNRIRPADFPGSGEGIAAVHSVGLCPSGGIIRKEENHKPTTEEGNHHE